MKILGETAVVGMWPREIHGTSLCHAWHGLAAWAIRGPSWTRAQYMPISNTIVGPKVAPPIDRNSPPSTPCGGLRICSPVVLSRILFLADAGHCAQAPPDHKTTTYQQQQHHQISANTMTKLFTAFFLLPLVQGWMEQNPFLSNHHRTKAIITLLEAGSDPRTTPENPCWQDIYDDDCSMDHAYAASFVASEWLKSMPCAEGIEDCDMPEALKVPGNREEGGADDIDVMEFLNLKRADSVEKKLAEDGPTH